MAIATSRTVAHGLALTASVVQDGGGPFKRLSMGITMEYPRIAASYNFFFGNVNRTIGKSLLKASPYAYADRNYVTLSVS